MVKIQVLIVVRGNWPHFVLNPSILRFLSCVLFQSSRLEEAPAWTGDSGGYSPFNTSL